MFDDRVYKRGALPCTPCGSRSATTRSSTLLRGWVAQHAHGTVSTAMFVSFAEQFSATPCGSLFDTWLTAPQLPPLP